MRKIVLALGALVFALMPLATAQADGFCSVAEGCSPCPLFEVDVSKNGVEITPVYC